jgi:hypothetical protein
LTASKTAAFDPFSTPFSDGKKKKPMAGWKKNCPVCNGCNNPTASNCINCGASIAKIVAVQAS